MSSPVTSLGQLPIDAIADMHAAVDGLDALRISSIPHKMARMGKIDVAVVVKRLSMNAVRVTTFLAGVKAEKRPKGHG